MGIAIEKLNTERFSMEFFRFGKGRRTLVILPGLSVESVMGSADVIADSYRSFAEDYTVFVFDRRADLPEKYSVRDMARDTAEAFSALGLEKIFLFGASQGGMIALLIAAENPGLVRGLALGSTCARVREDRYRTVENWIRLAKEGDRTGLYLDFGRALYPSGVFAQYRDALTDAAKTVTDADLERFIILAEGTRGFDASSELEKIECPVLALEAADDEVLGPDASGEIAEKLGGRPDFSIFTYEGYGHAAFDTAPDYRRRLLRFFAGIDGKKRKYIGREI